MCSESDSSFNSETSDAYGLGNLCTDLFGLLQLHWCRGFLEVIVEAFETISDSLTDLIF